MYNLYDRLLETCIHFTGIQNVICKADIRYDRVMVCSETQNGKLPCFLDHKTDNCAARSFYTKEQVEDQIKKINLIFNQVKKELEEGICPTCKQKISKHKQVGRCVYAEPCTHRLYQGKM